MMTNKIQRRADKEQHFLRQPRSGRSNPSEQLGEDNLSEEQGALGHWLVGSLFPGAYTAQEWWSAVPRVMLQARLSCSNSLLLQKEVTCYHSAPGNRSLSCLELWSLSSHGVKGFDSITRGKCVPSFAGRFPVVLESWNRCRIRGRWDPVARIKAGGGAGPPHFSTASSWGAWICSWTSMLRRKKKMHI